MGSRGMVRADPIAVVGMACRLPGGIMSLNDLWEVLKQAREVVTVPDGSLDDVAQAGWHGRIAGVNDFDADFFGVSPAEAAVMDPQQRVMLEVAYEAIESAGIVTGDAIDCSCFIGCSGSDHGRRLVEQGVSSRFFATGISPSIVANRISYTLNLVGPSVAVDTACSSSLVALHYAARSLRQGESAIALVGGVNVVSDLTFWSSLRSMNMLARDGRCKAFSANADGYVRSDGAAALILKRLEDAESAGDNIWAVIAGSAVNSDGLSNGLTAPNGLSQQRVIRDALSDGGLEAGDITYVEAHGTGTPLGDPIEIAALAATYGSSGPRPCYVGSVKSNIGHTEPVAGLAGTLKVILALKHGLIPATVNSEPLNPALSLAGTRLRIATRPLAWAPDGTSRVAAVSAFGFGGTNAHTLISAYDSRGRPERSGDCSQTRCVYPLSAAHPEALKATIQAMRVLLRGGTEVPEDVPRELATRRRHYQYRAAIVSKTSGNPKLAAKAIDGDRDSGVLYSHSTAALTSRDPLFVFSGQVGVAPGMGRHLLDNGTFSECVKECSALFQPVLGDSVMDVISGLTSAEELGDKTDLSQATLFTYQAAMVEVWRDWGVAPGACLGHSMGEVSAGYVSGGLSLQEAVAIITARGAAMQSDDTRGVMVVAKIDKASLQDILSPWPAGVGVAASNSPGSTVIAGPEAAISRSVQMLHRSDVRTTRLASHFAFHSPAMESAARRLLAALKIRPQGLLRHTLYSCVSGEEVALPAELTPAHWADGLRQEVKFEAAVRCALADGHRLCILFGPTSAHISDLVGVAESAGMGDFLVVHGAGSGSDVSGAEIDHAIAQLYVAGASLSWSNILGDGRYSGRLPSYQWRQRGKGTISRRSSEVAASLDFMEPSVDPQQSTATPSEARPSEPQIREALRKGLAGLLGVNDSDVPDGREFIRLGADSLTLQKFAGWIAATLDFRVDVGDLMGRLDTLERLSTDVSAQPVMVSHVGGSSAREDPDPEVHTVRNPDGEREPSPGSGGPAEEQTFSLLAAQMRLMNKQLDLIGASRTVGKVVADGEAVPKGEPDCREIVPGPTKPFRTSDTGYLDDPKRAMHVNDLVERVSRLSPASKTAASQGRQHLAESRPWGVFRASLKEALFPIVSEGGNGAHFFDSEGNRFTDYCLGFGVHLFGHSPGFLVEALQRQVRKGWSLGFQSPMAYSFAETLCSVLDKERVTFCNTGSEAVIGAVRLARLGTGRSKVVYFENSYHGLTDAMLGRASHVAGMTEPLAPGVPISPLGDVSVLAYGDPKSLDYIDEHAHTIAAVLVEPVQSRNPGLQPADFLVALRDLATRRSVVLIFDEMITGFRIALGGAQQYFEVTPDITTYGKILGGGMPIAAIAGDAALMDGMDGGAWQYGDESAPNRQTSIFGGTFQKHPLALAAGQAVLQKLADSSEELYPALDRRSALLANGLANVFGKLGLDVSVPRFGSMMRLRPGASISLNQPFPLELLYYELLSAGLHVWEGRTIFLSTAHSDSDVNRFLEVAAAATQKIAGLGFFDVSSTGDRHSRPTGTQSVALAEVPRTIITGSHRPATSTERIWHAWAAAPDSSRYNEAVALVFERPADVPALSMAVRNLPRHFPVLLSGIAPGGASLQSGAQSLDLRVVNPDEFLPSQDQRTVCRELAKVPFDLDLGPLLRIYLVPGESSHTVLLVAHHALCDGTSLSLVVHRLGRMTMGAAIDEPAVPMPDVTSARPANAATRAYWRQRLVSRTTRGVPASSISSAKPLRGCHDQRTMSQTLWERVSIKARDAGVTTFSWLVATFAYTLHRHLGREELIVGVPVDRRAALKQSGRVGNFLALVPVRSTLSDWSAPFSAFSPPFWKNLRDDLRNSVEVDYDVLDDPLSDLDYGRDIDALFNYSPDLGTDGWLPQRPEIVIVDPGDVKHVLALDVVAFGQGAVTDLSYAADHFTERDALGLHEDWLTRVARLSGLRAPTVPFAQTVPGRLSTLAEEQPDEVAVRWKGGQLSYEGLYDAVEQLSGLLKGWGASNGTIIGLCLGRTAELVVATLSALRIGSVFIIISLDLPEARRRQLMQSAGVSIVLVEGPPEPDGSRDGVWRTERFQLEQLKRNPGVRAATLTNVPSHSLAYLTTTSGTTGDPKIVAISTAGLSSTLASAELLVLRARDVLLSLAPTSVDAFIFEVCFAVSTGATLALCERDSLVPGPPLHETLRDLQVSHLVATPTALLLLDNADLPALRLVMSVGEALGAALATRWSQGVKLLNGYGPAEASIWSTVFTVEKDAVDPTAIGFPLDGVEMRVLDDDLRALPRGAVGQLLLGGVGVTEGYIGDSELTAKRIITLPHDGLEGGQFYATGDLVRMNTDSSLSFVGRADRQIKVRGYRVELGEVEACLRRTGLVIQAAAATSIDVAGEATIEAFVVLTQSASLPQVKAAVADQLPAAAFPSAWHVLEQLPQTESGKTDARASAALVKKPRHLDMDSRKRPLGAILHEAWETECGPETLDDNFFSAGGDSLSAIRMLNSIERETGLRIGLSDFFRSPTLAWLSATVLVADEPYGEMAADPVEGHLVPPGADST